MQQEIIIAGKVIKGEEVETLPPPEALIAKTVDTVDGDVFFHSELCRWINSDQFNPDGIPAENALSYTFRNT